MSEDLFINDINTEMLSSNTEKLMHDIVVLLGEGGSGGGGENYAGILYETDSDGYPAGNVIIKGTRVPNSVCNGWVAITSAKIASGVEVIGNSCFSGCVKLVAVFIPVTVTDIGSDFCKSAAYDPFSGALSFDIYYEGTQVQWNAITVSSTGNGTGSNFARATMHYEATGLPED